MKYSSDRELRYYKRKFTNELNNNLLKNKIIKKNETFLKIYKNNILKLEKHNNDLTILNNNLNFYNHDLLKYNIDLINYNNYLEKFIIIDENNKTENENNKIENENNEIKNEN
jgi:hypothetical protein